MNAGFESGPCDKFVKVFLTNFAKFVIGLSPQLQERVP